MAHGASKGGYVSRKGHGGEGQSGQKYENKAKQAGSVMSRKGSGGKLPGGAKQ